MDAYTPMTNNEKLLLLLSLANSIDSDVIFVELNDNIYPAIFHDDIKLFDENVSRIERLKIGDADKFIFISQLGKTITENIKRKSLTFKLNIFISLPCDKSIIPFFYETEIIKIK